MKKNTVKSNQVPIYRDAGFVLVDPDTTKRAFKDELDHPRSPDLYIYSRYRNPTVVAAEEKIMELERCEWALLTQSGMSAIDLALSIFQTGEGTGNWLFFSEIYGGTNSFIDRVLKFRRGLNIERFSPNDGVYDLLALEHMLNSLKPEVVYFEAISNPMIMVADAEAIIKLAKKAGARVILDNTFATPYLWNPLEMGADIVLHSATKYLSGHNNITAGVVCGNDPELKKSAIEYRKYVGHMLSPDDASRLSSQIRTFELRIQRHCDNAFNLSRVLHDHPKVETVLYPGLPSHPSHETAKKLFGGKGFGAMITFDMAGSDLKQKGEAAARFIQAISDTIPLIPTLGDAGTTLLHVESVWGEKYPLPGMIRLSVGIDPFDKLKEAILKGLEQV